MIDEDENVIGGTRADRRHRTGLALAVWAAGMILAIEASVPAGADPLASCMTRIIADVPAEEASEQVKSKGGSFGPVTRIKVNKRTGRMVYCSGTSYCYWSNALQLVSPCRIKRDDDARDETWFIYFTR